jgi:hypothetical protein
MRSGCIIVGGTLLMVIAFTFFFVLVGFMAGDRLGVGGPTGLLAGLVLALLLDLIMFAQIPGRMRRARARREWFRRTGFPGFY